MKQLFGLLLLVGFIGAYFWQIVAAGAVAVVVWLAWKGYLQARDEFTCRAPPADRDRGP